MSRENWIPTAVSIAIAVTGLLISSWVAYSATTNQTNARVSVIEKAQTDLEKRLDRIEAKLDTVVYYVTTGKK